MQRGPRDYCNNVNLTPTFLIYVDQNRTLQFKMNLEYSLTLAQISSVSLDEIFEIVKQAASSYVKNMRGH